MKKELSLLRIGLAALTLTVVSAGRTQTTKSENYFPLTEGSTWKLNAKLNTASADLVMTVTNSYNDGDATEATLEWSRPSLNFVFATETYRSTASGVDQMSGGLDGNDRINPPMPVIKYPLTAGAKWTWKGTMTERGEDVDAESASTVSGPISITTKAGTFKAMKVHEDVKYALGKTKYSEHNDFYLAPGVGLVQIEAKLGAYQVAAAKLISYKVKAATP